ncbi:MAG TPA: PPC domain-containing DNA-binding protein [Bryobacteraceae bacterium]|nr:PPC domain-containing DNA-binding protein [Bryobacteraceae bacterium]
MIVALVLWMAQAAPQPALPGDYVRRAPITARGLAPGMKVQEFSADSSKSRTFRVDMRRGDEIAAGLTEFAEKNHVSNAHLTGIGALNHLVLGWYDPEKRAYKKNVIDEEVELVSLTGNIAIENGKPFVHAHCVVAFKDGTTRGGHLLEGKVAVEFQGFVVDNESTGK